MKKSVKLLSLALALIFALCAFSAAAFTPDYYDYYYNRGYYSSVYPYSWTPYVRDCNYYYDYDYNYYYYYNPYYYAYPYYTNYIYGYGQAQNICPNNNCGRCANDGCYYNNSYCGNSELTDVVSPCVNGYTLDIKALGLSSKKASSSIVVNSTNCTTLRFDQMLVSNSQGVDELVLTLSDNAMSDNAAVGLACNVNSLQTLRNQGIHSIAFVAGDIKVGMTIDAMLVKAQDNRTSKLFIQLDTPSLSDDGVKALTDRALDGETVYRVSLYDNTSVKSVIKKIGVLVEYVVSDSASTICYYSNNKLVKPSTADCDETLLYATIPSGAPFSIIAD